MTFLKNIIFEWKLVLVDDGFWQLIELATEIIKFTSLSLSSPPKIHICTYFKLGCWIICS